MDSILVPAPLGDMCGSSAEIFNSLSHGRKCYEIYRKYREVDEHRDVARSFIFGEFSKSNQNQSYRLLGSNMYF